MIGSKRAWVLAAMALAVAGCGRGPAPMPAPQSVASATRPAPALIAAAPAVGEAANSAVTVLGALRDADWYMVITSSNNVKPLVIWSESKGDCEANVADFNLKSIDPSAKVEPPKAWCMTGQDLRARSNILK